MTEFFPGSRVPLTGVPGIPSEYAIPDEFGKDFEIAGKSMRLYSIGELAVILKRRPVTIRKWERLATIPKATFVKPGVDARGRRRLYSREQVEAMLRIAMEEKILDVQTMQISKTQFTPKVFAAFRELAAR